jgi:hypothetical protein
MEELVARVREGRMKTLGRATNQAVVFHALHNVGDSVVSDVPMEIEEKTDIFAGDAVRAGQKLYVELDEGEVTVDKLETIQEIGYDHMALSKVEVVPVPDFP